MEQTQTARDAQKTTGNELTKLWYTAKEVAERLGMNPRRIVQAIKNGRMAGINTVVSKCPKRKFYKVSRDELERIEREGF